MISRSFLRPAVVVVVAALVFQACSEDLLAPAQDAQEEMVELQITLPRPMFAGQPHPVMSDNLGPDSGKPRPPFMVPSGTRLLSLGADVSASDEPLIGKLTMVTDGNKEATCEDGFVEFTPGLQWVQVDLGRTYEIQAIVVWLSHRHRVRAYRDVIVRVSDDPDFVEYVELFNNDHDNTSGLGAGSDYEYVETNEGRLIDAKATRARYVRVYSNGNTSNDMNHMIEVEVYGRLMHRKIGYT